MNALALGTLRLAPVDLDVRVGSVFAARVLAQPTEEGAPAHVAFGNRRGYVTGVAFTDAQVGEAFSVTVRSLGDARRGGAMVVSKNRVATAGKEQQRRPVPRRQVPRKTLTCERCGGNGHLKNVCRAPECYTCGAVGHVSRACRAPTCMRCTRVGHEAADCQLSFAAATQLAAAKATAEEEAEERRQQERRDARALAQRQRRRAARAKTEEQAAPTAGAKAPKKGWAAIVSRPLVGAPPSLVRQTSAGAA